MYVLALSACNRTYNGEFGRILSPRYPSSVPRPSYCDFSIQAPTGKKITLYFLSFGLSSSANCTRSFLEV